MKAYYLFDKSPLPTDLNGEITSILKDLSRIKDQEEYLKAAFEVITSRYDGGRVKTVFKIWDLLSDDVENLWNRTGFLHCTNQNYLLTLLLVKGGLFKEKDIKPRWTQIWLVSPHQYLRVKVGDRLINVDAWAHSYGVPFGQNAHSFNTTMHRTK